MMVTGTEIKRRVDGVTGEVRKDGGRVGKWIAETFGSAVEFSIVDTHTNLVFLDSHNNRRSKAGRARMNDTLFEEIVDTLGQCLRERWRQATRRAITKVRSDVSEFDVKWRKVSRSWRKRTTKDR